MKKRSAIFWFFAAMMGLAVLAEGGSIPVWVASYQNGEKSWSRGDSMFFSVGSAAKTVDVSVQSDRASVEAAMELLNALPIFMRESARRSFLLMSPAWMYYMSGDSTLYVLASFGPDDTVEVMGKVIYIADTDSGLSVLLVHGDAIIALKSREKEYLGLVRLETRFFDPFSVSDSVMTFLADTNRNIKSMIMDTEVLPMYPVTDAGGKFDYWNVIIGADQQISPHVRLKTVPDEIKHMDPEKPRVIKLKLRIWVKEGRYIATHID